MVDAAVLPLLLDQLAGDRMPAMATGHELARVGQRRGMVDMAAEQGLHPIPCRPVDQRLVLVGIPCSHGREVEDALVQFLQAQRQARHLEQTVADAQRSVELVTKQFEGRITDFNSVYTTQTQLVTQQDQLAATRGNIAQYLIQVYRSIGGGWESFTQGSGMPDIETQAIAGERIPRAQNTGD